MAKIKSFELKINPKNGTVVIPRLARQMLGLVGDKNSLTLKVYEADKHAEITVPKYTLEDVLYNLPPLKSKKSFTNDELKKLTEEAMEEEAVKRYLRSSL